MFLVKMDLFEGIDQENSLTSRRARWLLAWLIPKEIEFP